MAGRRSDALVAVGAAASAARVLRRGFSARIISRFASSALRRGMHSGSRGWLYAGAAASGLKLLQSVVGRKEDVFSIRLRPGEAIEVREIRRAR
ncbi:MAG: hypothetical protein ACHQDE_02900 [Acidimicrobiia bacterium]